MSDVYSRIHWAVWSTERVAAGQRRNALDRVEEICNLAGRHNLFAAALAAHREEYPLIPAQAPQSRATPTATASPCHSRWSRGNRNQPCQALVPFQTAPAKASPPLPQTGPAPPPPPTRPAPASAGLPPAERLAVLAMIELLSSRVKMLEDHIQLLSARVKALENTDKAVAVAVPATHDYDTRGRFRLGVQTIAWM